MDKIFFGLELNGKERNKMILTICMVGLIGLWIGFIAGNWFGRKSVYNAIGHRTKKLRESIETADIIPRVIWGNTAISTTYYDENGDRVIDTAPSFGTIPKNPTVISWRQENKRQPKWAKRQ